MICYVDVLDCAVPVAPAFVSETDCEAALMFALLEMQLPPGMVVVESTCYNWGQGA